MGLASQDTEMDFTVWGRGVEGFEEKNDTTSFMHFTVENGVQRAGNRSRNIGRRYLRNLGSWDGAGDGVVGFDTCFGAESTSLVVA